MRLKPARARVPGHWPAEPVDCAGPGPGGRARPGTASAVHRPGAAAAGPCRAPPPPQAPAAPAQPAGMSDRLAQLKQLGELLSAGVLTQAEFEQQKTRILNG